MNMKTKDEIINFLSTQEQNKDIIITNEKPKCFTMKFSDVAKSDGLILSPFYYDFKAQATYLMSIVENSDLDKALKILETVAKTGSLSLGKETYVFNPVVRERLKEFLR